MTIGERSAMDNKNHVAFLTERVMDIQENGIKRVIFLDPDDDGSVGKLCVVGPAKPEYEGGALLLSYYKLIMNDNGKLALLEL